MDSSYSDVIIVGGGISGLATAYYLLKGGEEMGRSIACTLIEGDERLGGKIQTEHQDGFTIETGPDSLPSSKPWAIDLCRELHISGDLVAAKPLKTQILIDRKLFTMPEGMQGVVPSLLIPFFRSGLLSPAGKIRALLDIVIPKRKGEKDESIGSFIRRRLGNEVLERIAEPLLAGIHGGRAEELSINAIFPSLKNIENKYRSLILGTLLEKTRRRSDRAEPAFFTLKGGLEEIVDVLVSRIGSVSIIKGKHAKSVAIRPDSNSFEVALEDGIVLRARSVVLATPAYVTADLLKLPEISDLLRSIRYTSAIVVTFAFKADDALKQPQTGGFLVSKKGKSILTGCTFTSAKLPTFCPKGFVLLRCYLDLNQHANILDRSDEELGSMVANELNVLLNITGKLYLIKVHRWKNAFPQYSLQHCEKIKVLESMVSHYPGLYITGAAYHGIGVADCIHSGRSTAYKVLNFLYDKEQRGVSGNG